jgi:hypothetical protein
MQKFNFNILFNDDETFRGISLNDGTWFTLEEWNKNFTELSPQDSNTGTNVTTNEVQTDYTN